ncbi:DUF3048 family protein [Scopulibacillus darangshiensis]|uniref:DUF3048 family protein n=1 Tax=Scopulibacillus darangshiensis TaxID=442528 RepID=A0A4R2NQG5_9BACL|nr:DUF3048 domain-containing protein [Scopulibacillus darangshiensis]TCP24109.1 DUF3048 family protein [Scopulibacillus darangshiensis]
MKKLIWAAAMLFAVAVLMIGCSSEKNGEKNKSDNDKVGDVSNSANDGKKYPLTGLAAKGDIDQRVVGVMVNNHHKARPQSGIYKADIVYEVLAEGNITRFLALFQSEKPKIIGPVRSARPYFIKLNNGYHGLFIAHGWSPDAKKMLKSGATDNINGLFYDGTLFHRVDFRKAPHNSYIPYKNIVKGAKEKGYSLRDDVKPLPFLNKEEVKQIKGSSVYKATIKYGEQNVVSYVYNDKAGVFDRLINGEKSHDRETETPITAANVLIVTSDHRYIDSYGRRAIDLKSGGDAYLLQKGKLKKVSWKNKDGRILPYKNGKPVKFVPGKTWINIIPSEPGLDNVKIENKES